jgi:hypothetical protein
VRIETNLMAFHSSSADSFAFLLTHRTSTGKRYDLSWGDRQSGAIRFWNALHSLLAGQQSRVTSRMLLTFRYNSHPLVACGVSGLIGDMIGRRTISKHTYNKWCFAASNGFHSALSKTYALCINANVFHLS